MDDGSVSGCIMFSSATDLLGCGAREEKNSVILLVVLDSVLDEKRN